MDGLPDCPRPDPVRYLRGVAMRDRRKNTPGEKGRTHYRAGLMLDILAGIGIVFLFVALVFWIFFS